MAKTIIEMFKKSVEEFGDRPCLGTRKSGDAGYEFQSYAEVASTVKSVASKLQQLGLKRRDRIAILSENRPEWAIADLASLAVGAIDVPIYSTLRPEEILYILNDCEAKIVIVSDEGQLQKINSMRKIAPKLETVIGIDAKADVQWEELLDAMVKFQPDRIREDDLATIIYTSGTTGMPKGVMLSHENIMSNVEAAGQLFEVLPTDMTISYLPLSHSFERTCGYYFFLSKGSSIAYARSTDTLIEDISASKPTILLGVPRIFEKIYDGINRKVEEGSALKRKLFRRALKVAAKKQGKGKRSRLYDKLVFSKARESFGGRVKMSVSGAAALNVKHAEFMQAIGIPVFEGYGLTETSPIVAVNSPGASKVGTVGKAVPGVEVKLVDVPELDYYSSGSQGEVCVKGPNVMQGYFKRCGETMKVIDSEGWFHTGDIGEFDDEGFLRIIDRKGSVIKLSQGEKVAQEQIETQLKNSRYINQIMSYGDSKRRHMVALIFPEFPELEKHAKQEGVKYGSLEELVEKKEVKELFSKELEAHSKGFKGYERIRNFRLITEEFTQENGLLTPTLKVKRKKARKQYEREIEELYG